MSTRTQQRTNASSLLLIALAFVATISVSNQMFRGWRIDLTDNNLYTLSTGTEHILENMDERINLYFYYSDQATRNLPSLRSYANRVREMLQEFAAASGGHIRLSIIDPLPFSEEEDRAAQFGLQAVRPGGASDPVYLGLAGTDSVDGQEVIPFFQPEKESFLEYDIARLVSTLAHREQRVIGLVSGVRIEGDFDPRTQQVVAPWVIYQQVQQLFEIRNLGTAVEDIPDDLNLLWIVQPKDLSAATLYAIDQFIMRGGKALIFVDPVAEIDPVAMPGMPQGMPPAGSGSNLATLFDAWGLEFFDKEVVIDARLALQISRSAGSRPTRHFAYLGVTAEQMSSDDIITADLGTINLAMAGRLGVKEDGAATIEALLTSSKSSAHVAATRFSFLPDPSSLQDGFAPSGDHYVLAARVSGKLPSAFPKGAPTGNTSSEDTTDSEAVTRQEHLAVSANQSNLIVVADVDMLGDSMWVQVQNFFGQQLANAFANNGAFVINALESLSGSSDLIGVRSRVGYSRPFTRVDALRVEAEARFRQTEQQLQSDLADAERRLRELQSSREDSGNILLTPEQQREIDRFIDQRSTLRKELRAVQRGLDQNIERLGTILKVINIGLVPLLLTVFGLFAVWRRSHGAHS